MAGAGESFRLQLAVAAPVAELQAWLADAVPRARAIYASGQDLPRDAEGVVLARAWADQGLVRLFSERDPGDSRRFRWLIEKVGPVQAPDRTGQEVDRCAARAVLRLLRDAALRGAECPSNAQIARHMGWPLQRGRARAQYLIGKLERDGAIAVESRGTCLPRLVTILVPGTGKGRTTGSASGSKHNG